MFRVLYQLRVTRTAAAKGYAVMATPTCDLELFIIEHEAEDSHASCHHCVRWFECQLTVYCLTSRTRWIMNITTKLGTNVEPSPVPCARSPSVRVIQVKLMRLLNDGARVPVSSS